MFTLGIFTTHLPYIALVVFYAFFWIFGVNKATSGELRLVDNRISAEIQTGEVIIEISQVNTYDSQNYLDLGFLPPDHKEMFAAFQKLKHKNYCPIKHWQGRSYPALFSRPPPFIA